MWSADNYATKEMLVTHFKDSGKNEYRLGNNYSLFLAHMYPEQLEGQPDEFFYAIIARNSEMRNFRKRHFHKIEYNKRFISGSTVKEMVNQFKELFNDDHDPYRFL